MPRVFRPRLRDDRGSSSVEFVILFPLIALLLLAGPQMAMYYFGREAAQAAAVSAARTASTTSAVQGDGTAVAEEYLDNVGGPIESYTVVESQTATSVTITITGTITQAIPLPGVDVTFEVSSTREKERFTVPGGGG